MIDVNQIDLGSVVVSYDRKDYPDFADAFIIEACWKNGLSLTDLDLYELNEAHSDIAQWCAYDDYFGG